jgi:hypothetical protein
MRALVPVAPNQLGAVWPRLRGPMAEIEAPDGWIAEDVYHALRNGAGTLYLVTIDDAEVGFVVLRAINDFDGQRLHVWLLHSRSDVDVMAEFSDELDNIARGINATTITFGTTRRGWAKVAPKYGFSVRETVYSRSLQPKLANSP